MATLRALLNLTSAGVVNENEPVRELNIYDTDTDAVNNGGATCTWTVPADVTWVGVEMWGGGGAGGGCQCSYGYPGGSGGYGRKILRVNAGDAWTICAGGSTCCYSGGSAGAGAVGNGSYMCLNGEECLIAPGGTAGQSCCCWTCGNATPCRIMTTGTAPTGFTFGLPGLTGNNHWGCASRCHTIQATPGAAFALPTLYFSKTACVPFSGDETICGGKFFPGGGSFTGSSLCSSRCCCGGSAAGGLVTLIYFSATAP